MPVRNPSEIVRLEQELESLKADLKNYLYRDKQSKETILREIRNIEAALGIDGTPYNSSSF